MSTIHYSTVPDNSSVTTRTAVNYTSDSYSSLETLSTLTTSGGQYHTTVGGSHSSNTTIIIIVVLTVGGVILLGLAAVAIAIYIKRRKRREPQPLPSPEELDAAAAQRTDYIDSTIGPGTSLPMTDTIAYMPYNQVLVCLCTVSP